MIPQQKRPDIEKVLKPLKDFQRKSVEKAFQRLYLDKDRTNRFLIADEVGLGKTLVARGIIAKAIDHIWDKVDRIDVIYICSNHEIAHQNLNRLNITSGDQFSGPSRLTLLPLKISDLKKRKMNFVSFTPGTSFDLHSKTGLMLERALIYFILKEHWELKGAGPINVFQDWASKDYWRYLLKSFRDDYKRDQDLSEKFMKAVRKRIEEDKRQRRPDLRTRFDDLCQRFSFYKMHKNIPDQDRSDVRDFIGEMRMLLAQACLDALEPDIVILDEFQRFKYLLRDEQDEMSQLAKHFFNYVNKEEKTRIILLSATPYKMYTTHQEEAIEDPNVENHYKDFIDTVRFLFNDKEKTRQFEEKLEEFRRELFSIKDDKFGNLRKIKEEIEHELKKIMIRTERLAYTPDRDGMVEEKKQDICEVSIEDLEVFSVIDRMARELGTADMVEYWKSAPYLLNFMEDYELKRIFNRKLKAGELGREMFRLIKSNEDRLLKWDTIKKYKRIDIPNAKMRTLIENDLNRGSWQFLWMPASLPYYRPHGVFNNQNLQNYTKSIVFSCWQFVPKAISMVYSYEAERQMVTAYKEAELDYDRERRIRKPLLIFTRKEDRLQGMANFSLLYPCITLARRIDPLKIALEIMPKNGPPSLIRMKAAVRSSIEELVREVIGPSEGKRGRSDKRWYWACLALLDRKNYYGEVKQWFEEKNQDARWEDSISQRGDDVEDSYFVQHVQQFKDFFFNPQDLGRPPKRLVDVLTKLAFASPAVVSLRSLLRLQELVQEPDASLAPGLQGAAIIAAGFRFLFNLPESIALIRSLDDREPYWERVLDYGCNGNLQAVMDEYLHVLKESEGLIDESFSHMATKIVNAAYFALSLRTISQEFDEIHVPPRSRKVHVNSHRVRCRYALKLGEGRTEGDEEVTRSDQVRAAFNSPFRPFILATTSIGQEGLDFHQYCHSIYHWNLPSNPVDLEQREGRIHRYKGLVIRRNLAKHFGLSLLKENRCWKDLWKYLFDKGVEERPPDKDDIIPYWIFETKKGLKIDRHVPCIPLSREVERLQDLKQTLVMYRMVFGQPRQDDLVEFLKKFMDEEEMSHAIQNFRIDLSPK